VSVHDLRLRALGDTPAAFGITLAEAKQRTHDEWRERLAPSADRITVVEVDPRGRLIGMAAGFYDSDARVALRDMREMGCCLNSKRRYRCGK
jgi:hypothetical protein